MSRTIHHSDSGVTLSETRFVGEGERGGVAIARMAGEERLGEHSEKRSPAGISAEKTPGNKERQFVTALARGLDLLRCFSPGEVFLGNAELAKRTGIPKPTVSRLTYTLTRLGYLSYSEITGKYQLGVGVLSLGHSLLSNLDVRRFARPWMRELAEYSQVAVSLGVRDQLSMVYVESCRSNSEIMLRLDVGSRIPLASTAMGRAYICAMPRQEREALMEQIHAEDEKNWPVVRHGIETAMESYRERGFCVSHHDWRADVCAVGVPFVHANYGKKGGEIMAFSCGGPSFLLPRKFLEEDIGPRLAAMVRKVENALGRA